MVAFFFRMTSHYTTIVLEDKIIVTAGWYTSNRLPIVLKKVLVKRPRSGILFHHDNALSHPARQTTKSLKKLGIEILGHSPCNSNLTPRNYYLYSKIEEKLRGKWVTNAEVAVAAYEKTVEATAKCERAKCVSQWLPQIQRDLLKLIYTIWKNNNIRMTF
ncbi:Histone-lysine N-methyltransferase SETMAR [Eumeta japonica]|uniref:Histone-lysine N-methyltransferase SETMAR n=1 Tax=Eumeta variegata TaxID=151549 RepID=A0A4C1TXZ9_EUMVA|nr:Histone-lysine N-methyltransferase SETMAR [Eumeta japonica]